MSEEMKLSEAELKDMNESVAIEATRQSQAVISQAQRLFYEVWNSKGHMLPIVDGVKQFKRCLEMAEQIRVLCLEEQYNRAKKIEAEYRAELDKLSPTGESKIILPGKMMLSEHRIYGAPL